MAEVGGEGLIVEATRAAVRRPVGKGAAGGGFGVDFTDAPALVLVLQGLLEHHAGGVPGALGAGHLHGGGEGPGERSPRHRPPGNLEHTGAAGGAARRQPSCSLHHCWF